MKSGSVVIASGYFYVAGVVVVVFHIRELLALIQSSHMKLTKKNIEYVELFVANSRCISYGIYNLVSFAFVPLSG